MRALTTIDIFSRAARLARRLRRAASASAGFTLMEVNLAIFIMATGLLAMVALYPLAYRESRQSRDDVKSAVAADYILNTLSAAMSARNIKWNDWKNAVNESSKGWLEYMEANGNAYSVRKKGQIRSTATAIFNKLAGVNPDGHRPDVSKVPDDLVWAIVAQWGRLPVFNDDDENSQRDRSRVVIGVRVARRAGELMSQPIYYTEVHFQGDQKEVAE